MPTRKPAKTHIVRRKGKDGATKTFVRKSTNHVITKVRRDKR